MENNENMAVSAETIVAASPTVTKKSSAAKKPAAKKTVSANAKETKKVVAESVIEKVDFSENMDKIKGSVESINRQLKSTASEIAAEVGELNKEIMAVTKKGFGEIVEQIDVKEGVDKVKSLAKELNEEVAEKVKEVNADVAKKAEELKKSTTKLADEMVENLRINDRLATLKNVVLNSNKYALDAAHTAIEKAEKGASDWQHVAEKAVKTGLKIAGKQEDLIFSSLEAVKSQLGSSIVRTKQLFTTAPKAKANAQK